MPTPKKPSKKIVEKIQEKFETPDEFCYMYNAFIMGRLGKDKELEDWFLSMPEDELDEANNYYLVNERLKKFSKELQTIKRHCSNPDQKKLFNDLLESFDKNFKERNSYSESFGECPEKGCVKQDNDGNWRVISNKTGEYWPQTYDSEQDAKDALAAYHTNKGFNYIKQYCTTKSQKKLFNNLVNSFGI